MRGGTAFMKLQSTESEDAGMGSVAEGLGRWRKLNRCDQISRSQFDGELADHAEFTRMLIWVGPSTCVDIGPIGSTKRVFGLDIERVLDWASQKLVLGPALFFTVRFARKARKYPDAVSERLLDR